MPAEWGVDSDVPLTVQRNHVKTEYVHERHESSDGPDADLTDYPSTQEMEVKFQGGLERARDAARELGMLEKMSAALVQRPWEGETALVTQMTHAVGAEAPDGSPCSLVGCRVIVEGSPNEDLNGRQGEVAEYDEKSRKYRVVLENGDDVWIEGEFLRRLETIATESAQELQDSLDAAAVEKALPMLLSGAASLEVSGGDDDLSQGGGAAPAAAEVSSASSDQGAGSKRSSMCDFNAKRRSKANLIAELQQQFLAKKMSSARLTRVQEAGQQVVTNKSAAASDDLATVLKPGNYYACAFEDDTGGNFVSFGRLEAMKDSKSMLVREPMLLLDDAKRLGVSLLFTWFTDTAVSTELALGKLIHPAAYSAWCCMGELGMELLSATEQTYVFTDPSRREKFNLALGMSEGVPKDAEETPVTAAPELETEAQSAARRAAVESTRRAESEAAATADTREVKRAKGKRRATTTARLP